MERQKTAIVIGTGAGGATIARELQGEYQVTILEAGKAFKPLKVPVQFLAKFRKTGLFFDERLVRILIPSMFVRKSAEIVVPYGIGLGGTTTLSAGNAVRYDGALKGIGIDLDREFEELYKEIPITTDHRKDWPENVEKMYSAFEELGLKPEVMPKFMDAEKCVNCGQCTLGCAYGSKWDTRVWVSEAVKKGARLVTGCKVQRLEIKGGKVTAVEGRIGLKKVRYSADVIVLAAGGLGTPIVLEASGIKCEHKLFVDPLFCVAGEIPGFKQDKQMVMPFVSQQDGYIISPYLDHLSLFFDKKWTQPVDGIVSIMVKMADEETGSVDKKKLDKEMTEKDRARMEEAIALCRKILVKMGVPEEKQLVGKIGGAHPAGMFPLTENEKETLHSSRLPENLYVADSSLLPKSMGNPPILTIMALAKKIAGIIRQSGGASEVN